MREQHHAHLFIRIQSIDHLLHEEHGGSSSDNGRQDGEDELYAVVFGHFCPYADFGQGQKIGQ